MTYTHTTTATFTVASWDEHVIADVDLGTVPEKDTYYPTRGFTRAAVSYNYRGDIEGTSTLAYLISYLDGDAPISGFERFEGSIDGHEGSLVFRHQGTQSKGAVDAELFVVEGLGTGALENLRGGAEVKIAGESPDGFAISLSYDL